MVTRGYKVGSSGGSNRLTCTRYRWAQNLLKSDPPQLTSSTPPGGIVGCGNGPGYNKVKYERDRLSRIAPLRLYPLTIGTSVKSEKRGHTNPTRTTHSSQSRKLKQPYIGVIGQLCRAPFVSPAFGVALFRDETSIYSRSRPWGGRPWSYAPAPYCVHRSGPP